MKKQITKSFEFKKKIMAAVRGIAPLISDLESDVLLIKLYCLNVFYFKLKFMFFSNKKNFNQKNQKCFGQICLN